ncbi:hypothetical protein Tco_1167380 [Tanacetum coccineum]
MNIYKMPLEQFQVNTKFHLTLLPYEWSKFVTDVKLVKDLHTTNVDQLHAHLQQHERHAIEVRLMHERNPDFCFSCISSVNSPAYQTHPTPTTTSYHNSTFTKSSLVSVSYTYQNINTQHLFKVDTLRMLLGTTEKLHEVLMQVVGNPGKPRTVICYNCKERVIFENIALKPKLKRDETWFNDKVLLVQGRKQLDKL